MFFFQQFIFIVTSINGLRFESKLNYIKLKIPMVNIDVFFSAIQFYSDKYKWFEV